VNSRKSRTTIALACLVALATGCMFRGVRRDVAILARFAWIRGTVEATPGGRGDVLVVVYTAGASTAADVFTLDGSGKYFFMLPAGAYRVMAFEDANEDRVFEPESERSTAPIDVQLGEGEHRSGVDLHLSATGAARVDLPPLPPPGQRGVGGLPPIEVGTVTTLDDPRFSAENGRFGMWEPVEFMFSVGAGIYFLDACDAVRTPILFVHGIGGYPSEFKYLVGRLDRRRFQPWFAYYPSGLELGRVAEGLERWMQVLQAHCGFRRLIVVAHSMGGLVARAFIERAASGVVPTIPGIDTFVSISTPWGGHAAAERGVEHAPAVVPAWRDLAPGSPFLQTLMATPLPRGMRYYLFFSFGGGKRSPFLDDVNDGVVGVASELDPRAQLAAQRMFGVDRSHTGILSDESVATELVTLLAKP
jgi:pimeloyl-ACP methyl ester carboxylesterase